MIVGGGVAKKSLYAFKDGFGFHSGNAAATGTREWLNLPAQDDFRHVACVWDGRDAMLFIDGQPAATPEFPKADEEGPRGFYLGAEPRTGSKEFFAFFGGELDEIRFSRSARYTKAFVAPDRLSADAETVALYHCDEGAGDVLRDSSGHNHHGKIVGAKWVRIADKQQPIE